MESTPKLGRIFSSPLLPAAAATINPNINDFTINPGQNLDEVITVTIPANAVTTKADVYFLADTTGSMSSILSAVQSGANTVLSSLSGLGIDIVFGVGNYKDFRSGDPYGFQHQVSPTNNTAAVTAGINAWSASGGDDIPEADLFALNSLAEPPGGIIGWRSGSERIIVWFGDAPGHDPVCKAASGASARSGLARPIEIEKGKHPPDRAQISRAEAKMASKRSAPDARERVPTTPHARTTPDGAGAPSRRAHHDNKRSSHFSTKGETLPPSISPGLQLRHSLNS